MAGFVVPGIGDNNGRFEDAVGSFLGDVLQKLVKMMRPQWYMTYISQDVRTDRKSHRIQWPVRPRLASPFDYLSDVPSRACMIQ